MMKSKSILILFCFLTLGKTRRKRRLKGTKRQIAGSCLTCYSSNGKTRKASDNGDESVCSAAAGATRRYCIKFKTGKDIGRGSSFLLFFFRRRGRETTYIDDDEFACSKVVNGQ